MEVRHHPLFVRWLEEMAVQNEEIFGELMALLEALEDYGRAGAEVAVALVGGDKTTLGRNWYPVNRAEAEYRLNQFCQQHSDLTAIVKRGNR